MRDTRHIHGNELGFRDAYRKNAFDLHVAHGCTPESFVPPADEWYLDQRLRILAWIPDGTIQGFVIYAATAFFYPDTDGEVLDIWVASTYRRRGIGRQLAAEALGELSGRIGLQVHAENSVALAFWESLALTEGMSLEKEACMAGGDAVWKLILGEKRERVA